MNLLCLRHRIPLWILGCFLLLILGLASCGPAGPQPPVEADTGLGVGRDEEADGPAAEVGAGLARGSRGMVSSAHPLATRAGLEILRAGGNAFDAAVAVAATLNVVEPMMSGIGGYGTILVWDSEEQEAWFLNSSAHIPKGLDSDVFRAPTPNYEANRRGAKAISTPGNVPAWWALSERYGELPWADLFASAIRAAEEGFPVGQSTAEMIAAAFEEFPAHARAFYGQEGRPLATGETLVQRDLGMSLRQIAETGPGAMATGSLAKAIGRAMADAGSFLTLEDLEQAKAKWWEPIGIDYRGHRVLTASPPATAFPSLIRLGMMSQVDVPALGRGSAEYLHLFAEVSKHAFWCRLRHAGDPDIQGPPLDLLLSDDYWREQVALLDRQRASVFEPPGPVTPEGRNTTHFVVADREGNIVSATQTLGNLFGSRIMVEGTGIWLNNSLAYCTFEPAGNPMDAHAGHHKLSGDCPTLILKDGKPWAALGTPGGHTIGQTVPQMVINLIDFDLDIHQAIAEPRISFIEPDYLLVEEGVDEAVRQSLEAMGHRLLVRPAVGNAHGLTLHYDNANRVVAFAGSADPRVAGLALGLDP